jgi:tRNA1(Val) A37 N6-methylase TrmN6
LISAVDVDACLAVQARSMLPRRGRVFVHARVEQALPWLAALRDAGLEPKHLRLLHTESSSPPVEALITARVAKRGGLVIESSNV